MNSSNPYPRTGRERSFRTVLAASASVLVVALLIGASPLQSATNPDPSATIAAIDSVLKQSLPLKGKVVYVDFWASWCMPCRHSFPWMKELAAKYGDKGLQIVTVNLDKKRTDAEKFLGDMGSVFPVIYDSTGALAKTFKVDAMPTSFLYDRDGNLHSRHRGFEKDEAGSLDSVINVLINKGTGQ